MLTTITDLEPRSRIEISQSVCIGNANFQIEPMKAIRYKVKTLSGVSEISIFLNEADNTDLVTHKTSRKGLIESVTQPSRMQFFNTKMEELQKQYSNLNYKNEVVLDLASDIINDCIKQKKFDINISRTGDNEILIFRETNGVFNNIIIDEDADIEYLHIPINRADTYNEHYSFIDNLDTFTLSSKL